MGAAAVAPEHRGLLDSPVYPALVRAYWHGANKMDPNEPNTWPLPTLAGLGRNYLELRGRPVSPAYDEWFTTALPLAQQEFWDGAGHWIHLSRANALWGRIVQFVNDVGR